MKRLLLITENDQIITFEGQLFLSEKLFKKYNLDLLPIYSLNQENIYSAVITQTDSLPQEFHQMPLRHVFDEFGEQAFCLAGKAKQIITWDMQQRFCSGCGQELIKSDHEFSKFCSNCNRYFYPIITPAIIVLITRGQHMLLARSYRFSKPFYSALAGFVEFGETLEQTVQREVKEEVDIEVDNIRYLASQAWPFPHQLMLGFLAEYKAGEIKVDGKEIMDAQWFSPENLPLLPNKISIARRLIDHHLNNIFD